MSFPNQPQHRTSVPDSTEGFDLNKPDPYDLYEKSRAIYESRRPEYEEVEVHLLREKTGFGFRILGGDEAVQAVSPDARDKARMGRAGPHTYLTSYTPTPYLHLTSSHSSSSYTHLTNIRCTHIYTQALTLS
ncbi:membrane-associated guanylate kinase, WW and PDZ domain-containing protein 2-like [Notothenia coriiceps]|uniref:Membrane-associated guanylate kinase, WW and PDZ domain-containing protein 2-like n=1 Tax=Notothenia coriiceps TaxID=8208 RepID=A0A6I9P2Z2_9TELE|nr:PREDICTED: membrane-associated guanylate kinase, WW and PDZ domain-containing protein 2-like [Notothenia coriiceps]